MKNDKFVNFIDSLPQDQDCHEMWSKQRRRKMAQAQGSSGLLNNNIIYF